LPAADAEAIGNPINVVEPAGDQVDLQDGAVVETDPAQAVEVFRGHLPGVPRELGGVVEHGPVGLVQRRLRVVPPQRGGEFLLQRDPGQELGVTLNSVKAAVQR
jgi:hypothetical protein